MTLAWDPSTGATSYRLYYGTSSGTYPNSINTGAATSATVTGLTAGQRYYFVVTAFSSTGAQSPYSNEVNAVAPALPVASFVADKTSGPVPLTVNFSSSASTGTITSYAWTFGDGGTSAAANPSHTYTSTGTFTVALTVSGPGGTNTQTRTGYLTVNVPAPAASFTANVTSGNAPLTVNFTNLSTGSITSYAWTFGDGGTSTAANPSHSYASAGTYTVALTVTGPGGSNALTRTGYVSVSPAGSPQLTLLSSPVDLHAATGTTGGLNGVLEPGESVMLEPVWRNDSATPLNVTGTISNFTGPAGGTYTINDGSASYGTIAAGATADCRTATGNCYRITVGSPAVRPALHWDVTLKETLSTGNTRSITVHVGQTFSDMPASDAFYSFVEEMVHNQVTTGFTDGTFAPTATSTGVQSMMFAARGMLAPLGDAAIPVSGSVGGSPYDCSAGGVSRFADILPTDVGCKQVHFLASQGVNVSFQCSDAQHACPAASTTRALMAVLIAGAAKGGDANVPASGTFTQSGSARSYNCASGGSSHFPDVSVTSSSCRHINYLWAVGAIDGYTDGTFRPAGLVNRAQMAKFITNGFGLTLN
ncbi:MAG: PKD domain-containing protein [Burkholderiales bacterium]